MEFSITRLFKLMRKDFIIHRRYLMLALISMFAVCGLLVFMTSSGAPTGSTEVPPDAGEIVFSFLLLVGGALVTAMGFREFRDTPERLKFLSLPASNFEKVFSKWLYTLPFYFIMVTVVFVIGYPLFSSLVDVWIGYQFVPLEELELKFYKYFALAFFLGHSIIFLLALIYNRFPIPKIIVTGFILFIISALLLGIIFRIVFYDHFQGLFQETELFRSQRLTNEAQIWIDDFFKKLPGRFAMIGVPFIWLITYFKMKEKEV